MKTKLLLWHMGLGDAIAMAPMVVQLSRHNPIIIPCYQRNYVSVVSIFGALKDVTILSVPDGHDISYLGEHFEENQIIRVGYYSPIKIEPGEDHIMWMYRQVGLDWQDRWKHCPINKLKYTPVHRPQTFKPFLFFHQDTRRRLMIDTNIIRSDLQFIEPLNTQSSILAWRFVMASAEEIHVIDSAFYHLAEAVDVKDKLFLHQYARPKDTWFSEYKSSRKNWTTYNFKIS